MGFTNYVQTQLTPEWIFWIRPFEANVPDLMPDQVEVGSSAVQVAGWLAELGIPQAVVVVDADAGLVGAAPLEAVPDAATLTELTVRFGPSTVLAPAVPMANLDDLARWLPSLGTKIHAALQTQTTAATQPRTDT
ncbi:hypothetical protein [Pseudonocardia sp. KRD291]|uniref:hypothetical protein n=1 Tax=Pseudonocardia sp. KRD291 TaxID=2792007 RepID=UPI001C4A3553|nr:hypothetical protein [Pseudonocardia sp. KRD291]MBW0104307.1 hypothetical protein [Pseudonocardia sp. KRD291]